MDTFFLELRKHLPRDIRPQKPIGGKVVALRKTKRRGKWVQVEWEKVRQDYEQAAKEAGVYIVGEFQASAKPPKNKRVPKKAKNENSETGQ